MHRRLSNMLSQYSEVFNYASPPHQIINSKLSNEEIRKSLGIFIDLELNDIDYYLANLILLESEYYSDEAILYFLPKFLELLIDNEGHIHSIYSRLKVLNFESLNSTQNKFIKNTIDELIQIEIIFHKSDQTELIAWV